MLKEIFLLQKHVYLVINASTNQLIVKNRNFHKNKFSYINIFAKSFKIAFRSMQIR